MSVCHIADSIQYTSNGIVAESVYSGARTDDRFFIPQGVFIRGSLKDDNVLTLKNYATDESGEKAAVFGMLENKIFHKLHFPAHWSEEGVTRPNAAAKEKCFAICKKLFTNHLLIPASVASSREGGLCLFYDRVTPDCDRTMIVEIYNNLETALIVCDNTGRQTIHAEDIFEMDFSRAVAVFKA